MTLKITISEIGKKNTDDWGYTVRIVGIQGYEGSSYRSRASVVDSHFILEEMQGSSDVDKLKIFGVVDRANRDEADKKMLVRAVKITKRALEKLLPDLTEPFGQSASDTVQPRRPYAELSPEYRKRYDDMPISELGISNRASNCLKNVHIETIGQLAQRTGHDLCKIRNLGKGTLVEIKRALSVYGLALAQFE